MKRSMQSAKGFTLVELLVVVVIIGILTRVAYSSYQDSMQKSRRADAKSVLLQNVQFMERTNTLNNTYKPNGANPTLPFTQSPINGTPKYYNLSITASTASTFTLSAVPIAGTPQAGDVCGTLTIDHTGAKTPTTAGCW